MGRVDVRIATVYLGRRGGGNLYTFYLAQALQRVPGVQQKLFLQGKMENIALFRKAGFAIEEFGTYERSLLGIAKIPFRLLKLKKAIEQFAPDIVYVPMFNPYIPFLFRLLPSGVKKVYTLHGSTSYGGRTRTLIENRLQDKAIAASDYVITLTKYYRSWMARRFPEKKVFVVPHPAFEYFARLGRKRMVAGKYILFIGRVEEKYKGFQVLHRAFEKIKDRIPLRLVIAGKSDRPASISKDPKYQFINRWLSDEEFASLARHAWTICLPYTQPTPSGVVAVALALGKPVIASDVAGLNEQVVDGKSGVLVPAGDEDALATAIERLYGDRKWYTKLQTGAKTTGKALDVSNMAKRMRKIVGGLHK